MEVGAKERERQERGVGISVCGSLAEPCYIYTYMHLSGLPFLYLNEAK